MKNLPHVDERDQTPYSFKRYIKYVKERESTAVAIDDLVPTTDGSKAYIIEGIAGIGKSTLLRALKTKLSEVPHQKVYLLKFSNYAANWLTEALPDGWNQFDGTVFLLLDGLDEISGLSLENGISFLNNLRTDLPS